MRVLVCGGRAYVNYAHVFTTLRNIPITTIIHGVAAGADSLAHRYAREQQIPVEIYHALWHVYGKAAGSLRNQQMLDEGKPDLVVAFSGGKGTADMIHRALQAGVKVLRA